MVAIPNALKTTAPNNQSPFVPTGEALDCGEKTWAGSLVLGTMWEWAVGTTVDGVVVDGVVVDGVVVDGAGIVKTQPGSMRFGFVRSWGYAPSLACTRSLTDTPNLEAIDPTESPVWTVYIVVGAPVMSIAPPAKKVPLMLIKGTSTS